MKKLFLCILVTCLLSVSAFAQLNNATFTGTVSDSTKAVLPGVTITATNTATGVVLTNVTNEAGAYTILSLLPGTYTVTAELPGFQKANYTNVDLGNNVTVRLNFTLNVATQSQNVEVTVAADTVLATSSPTIGQVMTQKKINDLPVVGGNVLDMLSVLGGIDNMVLTGANPQAGHAFGREGTTLAGVSAQDTPVLRDGIMVSDTRWPTGLNTNSVINPDLVGEIRLIVAPVDAEFGRGNGAVQITTRSGTNQFRGAAVWNIENSKLFANTWGGNQSRTPLNWFNNNQGTASLGGPIIKNKTFFYGLWDMNFNRQRAYQSSSVLTPCARNGIFRYFDGWNNGAYGATTVGTGGTPTRAVVDLGGNPLVNGAGQLIDASSGAVVNQPNGSPSLLHYISVFGPGSFTGGAPNADCSNFQLQTTNIGGQNITTWDQNRTKRDTTGLIDRTIAFMPAPNDWNFLNNNAIDGLNTATWRTLAHFRGADNLFSVGEATGDRRQANVRIDHNFSQRHRVNGAFTIERVSSDDVPAALPNTWSNQNFHRPKTVSVGFVSTLSASLVNEAKFGYRFSGTNVVAPWDRSQNYPSIAKYLPPNVNGFQILPDIAGGVGLCSPITGGRPPAACTVAGANGANLTTTATDASPVWTYGDSVSWTKGKHTVKIGGEMRFTSSFTTGSAPGGGFFQNNKTQVVVVAGSAPNAQLAFSGPSSISNTNPYMSGLGTNSAAKAQSLLNFLAGSISSINNEYFLNKPTDTTFADFRTSNLIPNTIKEREISIFGKDDFKVSRNLTLNLGLRYDWYGVPFSPDGLAAAAVGGGGAGFGISGRDFSGWMNPGTRSTDTVFQFVGKNSPHPGSLPFNNDYKNFGPAIGFAYQLPWLGEGKTTIRGGYQITFQGGGRFSTLENALSQPPGRVYAGQYTGTITSPYMDLTSVTASTVPTPLPAGVAPMTAIPRTDRTQTGNFFDPNYTSPYVQNLTLSVTRSIKPNLTLDVRYIGTLSRKQYASTASINLNTPNFLYNGLGAEFDKIRAGGESTMLDSMLKGVNICMSGCAGGTSYGAIGTTVNGVPQTAAQQMRSSATFATNLALGNYSGPCSATGAGGVACALGMLNYTQAVGCSSLTDPAARSAGNCDLPFVNTSTTKGAVLRVNGNPENLIFTNPQFLTANWFSNMGNSNYHSVQVEATLRPTHGFSGTANYTFSRNLGLTSAFTNPVDRHGDYTIVNNNHPHILRTNGNIELPIGPGKLLAGGSHGPIARAIEGWRLGGIYTLSSGPYANITAQNMLYANGVPDVTDPALLKELLANAGTKWGIKSATGVVEGDFFDRTKFIKVPDPQCANVTANQGLNVPGPFARCNLQAIARVVPANTPGANVYADPNNPSATLSAKVFLQNPKPGTRGNLGQNVLRTLPVWRFDTNISKAFKITESKSLSFRMDVFNVLNHAQPGAPGLSINNGFAPTPFGEITTKNGNDPRVMQAQLRLDF
jgi:hypothetical protein